MPLAISEQLYKNDHIHHVHEWEKDTQRRTRPQYPLWQPYHIDHADPRAWEIKFCEAEPISSPREQSAALNVEIDEIYDQLAVLVAKRHTGQTDSGLEEQITQLFQRLRMIQKQEGNLIRAMIPSTQTSKVAAGLAILKRVEQLRAKYGDTATPNSTAQGPNTTEA